MKKNTRERDWNKAYHKFHDEQQCNLLPKMAIYCVKYFKDSKLDNIKRHCQQIHSKSDKKIPLNK